MSTNNVNKQYNNNHCFFISYYQYFIIANNLQYVWSLLNEEDNATIPENFCQESSVLSDLFIPRFTIAVFLSISFITAYL